MSDFGGNPGGGAWGGGLWGDPWVVVRRSRRRSEAERYALVLAAMGITSRLHRDGEWITLSVAPHHAASAEREIGAYVKENSHQTPAAPTIRPGREALLGVLAYACVLFFLHGAALRDAFGLDWLSAGAAQAGLILDGQLWRTATALGLHGDGTHLLGNLALGGFFGFLLAQLLGGGLAWLAILVSGAVGNLLAAVLRSNEQTSIGASTAVFAALGLLCALSWRHQAPARFRGLRRWLPFAAGAMLLAYLGVGGERTDVLAHVTGFAAGAGGGFLLAQIGPRVPLGSAAQLAYALAAVLLFTLAWLIALAV
ncbi:rhomboid family intramembrane serine protease [Aquibaculum arenosum]|uniref:Rhomboid family intramembrane serine protease n=1 Tax=Aquibaculum arenosum TaxID=3032591 RepID=A0ABT5YQ47_9PROT|nr:rhomboid family intramembrane serine protease [Fodinicurvata sp. CAU 1616]MDF2097073.1 rhomboid family intramembrane serine protease [Fodinicurvata sp. CAU 1616]